MADLSKVKRPNRLAVLKRVQEQPMPPARVPLNDPVPKDAIAGEAKPEPVKPPEIAAPELAQDAPAPKAEPAPAKAPTPSIKEATAPSQTRRYRFSLQFDDPALKTEAEGIAATYGVPLAHIIKAIASEAKITADDFRQASVSTRGPLRPGGSVRVEMAMDAAEAESWLKKHDPLKIQPASIVLRPVAIRAFERIAPRKLALLKKEK